jgi:hypothetical protein
VLCLLDFGLECGWISLEDSLDSCLLLVWEESVVVAVAASAVLAAHLICGEAHAVELEAFGCLASATPWLFE